MIDYLIFAAVLLAVAAIIGASLDASRRHAELIQLLNDLATMLGELFDRKE